MRNLEKQILENLLALRAYSRIKKYVPSMPMHQPNNLINIERSISPVNKPVDPKQIATEIINTPAFSL